MAFDKVIVLDDELIIRKSLESQLRKRRYCVASASTIAEADEYFRKDQFDLIFADVKLPDGDGTELLDRFKNNPNGPMIVIITGDASIESAVECMKNGAFDYLVKPFSMDQIDIILKKAEEFNQLVKVNQYFNKQLLEDSGIIGKSPSVKKLNELIKKVAATGATVLITGENGTGKELVAQELYRLSPLSSKPYIKVNCAAIAETLIESEFFGHEKGAFTGATQRREGRFELAHNGTILLDEIGEISLQVQAKLLRVLQEGEFERVGGNKTLKTNVRVLATTNRNLLDAVAKGDFREDLYYRLNVFPIEAAPLRDRADDIPLLAKTFLDRFIRKHGCQIPGFTDEALKVLCEHAWPGNIRELQNTIERAVILTDPDKSVRVDSLGIVSKSNKVVNIPIEPVAVPLKDAVPESISQQNTPATGVIQTLDEIEKDHIFRALEVTKGKRSEAAGMLKISVRTLRNKLNQYSKEGGTVECLAN